MPFPSGLRIHPLARALLLFAGLLIDIAIVAGFAINLQELWAILLISLGILIGLITIRGNGSVAGLICFLGLVTVPLIVVVRAMPVHSFEWADLDGLDRIVIQLPLGSGEFEINEPRTLSDFIALVRVGSYQTSLKCGECYGITLYRGPNAASYVIRYDSFGHGGAASCETIFVPKKKFEFRKWLEDVLVSRGRASGTTISYP